MDALADINDTDHRDCGEIEFQKNAILQLRQLYSDEVKNYSRLTPWKSYLAIASQWVIIACSIAIAVYSKLWPVWLLAVIVIATRQHALMMMGHEAAHFRISKNRAVNDFCGDMFCFLPLFLCLQRWQSDHIKHHRYANTEQDPYWDDFNGYKEWHWPKTKREAIIVFVRDALGFNSKMNMESAGRWSFLVKSDIKYSKPQACRVILFVLLLLTGLSLTGGWLVFILLWIVPLLTFTVLFIRIRSMSEHLGIPGFDGTSGIDATRHVDANCLERLIVSPLNINYHLEHHIFPSVPFYNLPKLHKVFLESDIYLKYAHIKPSYFAKGGVMSELIKD